jgi:hypothetical protein
MLTFLDWVEFFSTGFFSREILVEFWMVSFIFLGIKRDFLVLVFLIGSCGNTWMFLELSFQKCFKYTETHVISTNRG